MRPGGQARIASISGIFEPARPMFSAPLTGCSAGRMYRYIELRTRGTRSGLDLGAWGYSLYSSTHYRLWWRFFFRPRIPLTIAA